MIKVNVKVNNLKLNSMIKKQRTAYAGLPVRGLTEFKRLTPIGQPSSWKSKPPANYIPGNARASTSLRGNNIEGDYAYAQRLDNNWSKQTRGKGIVAPFTKWWIQQIKKIARMK